MKTTIFRLSTIAAAAAAALCGTVGAEDIDLFTTPAGGGQNPNVVILIDNSANWDSNAQHWTCTWTSPCKQGQSELRSIRRVLDEVDDKLNLGLMMFTPGPGSTPSGAYVRFHVRQMTATNKAGFKELIGGDTGCIDGPNSLTGSPDCILKNFSTPNEKVGTAKTDYSAGMFEVFKYWGGFTYPAVAHADPAVAGSPTDFSHFGPFRYARTVGPNDPAADAAAFTSAAETTYNDVVTSTGNVSCAKNYLIFIGNGFPSQDAPCSLLQGVNGITNCTTSGQLFMPQFNMTQVTTTSTLGTDSVCETTAQCAASAAATFGTNYDTYACTGGTAAAPTPLGVDTVCESTSQCATRAQSLFPGHPSYLCSGGTPTAVQSGTDLACESAAACATRAATVFPDHPSYSCTGGSQTSGTVSLGTDTVRETIAQCIARAQAQFPGYTSYNCINQGNPITSPPVALGVSGNVCETAAACQTRMATVFPGHTAYSCVGGASPITGIDAACEKLTGTNSCATVTAPAALPSATSWTCVGGTSCSGGKVQGATMQGTCAVGKLGNYTVTATDTTYGTQLMVATGCTATGALTGQTMSGAGCTDNQNMFASDACLTGQTIKGTKTVNTVVATNTSAQPTNTTMRFADEWARYIYLTDVNAAAGFQNVQTYTIDVFKDAQDPNETALLLSMAKYGGGRYFQATNEDAILNALREILVEIQSVNSVFASASLPISAANRSQNENQIYIGMFRPDGKADPKWYGNLKRFQVALFGSDAKLADKDGKEALSATTGFVQACATSYFTTSSNHNDALGNPVYYWDFSPSSAGTCTSIANSTFDDLPDGGVVEKGSVAEVIRKGNAVGATFPYSTTRTMKTCAAAPCTSLADFTSGVVTITRTGAPDAATNQAIVDFTYGKDVTDENGRDGRLEPRASVHGDVTHSRPLPVNYGTGRGVRVYYGSNDSAYHAVSGEDGHEIWSFVAPEHHSKLIRLYNNAPKIAYPPPTVVPANAQRKDYFFDGSTGIYETFNPPTSSNADKVWIFPSMRRGGRMVYGFDVSNENSAPIFKFAIGCPNLTDDVGCTAGTSEIGQTWSTPSVALIKGFSTTTPVLIFGGGYDNCEDVDSATTACTASNKGHKVYVVNASNGTVLQSFNTDRAVPADVALIDRDLDGMVDHAYIADTGGNVYRIDFVDPSVPPTPSSPLPTRAPGAWTITKIAFTNGGARKFLFAPAVLATSDRSYIALGTGDRERPLIQNYPYTTPVLNRYYMLIDMFPAPGAPIDLDSGALDDFTGNTTCATQTSSGSLGWRLDLNASGTGEQTVTSSVIFGGAVFFSTNRPVAAAPNTCATNLGEARAYAVNLLNASGIIGTGSTCGGSRSDTFVGGGLPPSPVVGTVQVQTAEGMKTIPVLIGGANLSGGPTLPTGAQTPPVPIAQIRSRIYWYRQGDK